ncbi:hypothetical protein GCM10010510_32030 [Streptomyces anandii JCM 4720]|nr:hypothetical protein GCM10010510_32030 [Streptomyces anandii JCM 4720]
MHDIKTLGTIGRGHDLETLELEIDPDQLPDHLVVVHNKHPARSGWHNSRVGRPRPPRPGFPHFRPVRGTPPHKVDATVTRVRTGKTFMTTPTELVVFYPSPRRHPAPDAPP